MTCPILKLTSPRVGSPRVGKVYRHFGRKTLQHHRDGSKMSGQFDTDSEVSMREFGTSAELSAVKPLFNN